MTMTPIALGVDPGFSSFGWARIQLTDVPTMLDVGVIRTEKAAKKQNVYACEDNIERARIIRAKLAPELMNVDVICAESMSFPRNASVAAKVSLAWGILVGLADEFEIPIVQASPQFIKKTIAGVATASKQEIEALTESSLLGSTKGRLLALRIPEGQHEHAFDAAAAVLALQRSEIVRALFRRAA